MIAIPGYKSLIPIYESENSIVYRGRRDQDDGPVILKSLKKDYPTPEEFARYKHEYGILRNLNQRYQDCTSHIIVVYALEKYEGTPILVMEDFGAESLKRLMVSQEFTLSEMLNIAIQISQGLTQVHAAHMIHKDINPSNIALNLSDRQVRLIDFGIAELATPSPESPTSHAAFHTSHLEGTLAYISPEQTGRMNRPTDYRSDFYSLGVTLYELFTGHLPFEADDPMKLVHAHIAKTPVSPHETVVSDNWIFPERCVILLIFWEQKIFFRRNIMMALVQIFCPNC
ncbi:MAG: hypothetical protein B6245_22315, partial [Desulfobacteraceae bacterium 4572_88]